MREITYDTWERREVYEFFAGISNPFYMVTFKEDVSDLNDYCKAHDLSFYMAMVWVCTKALNSVEAFRIIRKDGKLFVCDRRHPSFTYLKKGSEQFQIVTVEDRDDLEDFCKEALRMSQEQKAFINMEKEVDNLIYISCMPWIELTALTNERDLSTPEALDDNIPRIAWGKYVEENGRKKLGISLEVNHRFIDGYHIGLFAQAFRRIITELKDE